MKKIECGYATSRYPANTLLVAVGFTVAKRECKMNRL